MKSFRQKGGLINFLNSRPVLIFLAIILLFFAWGVISFMGKMHKARENKKIAEIKVAELEKEKSELAANIAKLKTESGIEGSIREKFGLAREGESIIIIVEDKDKENAPAEKEKGFFAPLFFWKNWFK